MGLNELAPTEPNTMALTGREQNTTAQNAAPNTTEPDAQELSKKAQIVVEQSRTARTATARAG